jgi:hypothetical protein
VSGNERDVGRGRWSNDAPRWSPGGGANQPSYGKPRWARGTQPPRRRPQDGRHPGRRPDGGAQPARRPDAPVMPAGGEIDRFELFCAYHLGITADGTYRIQNIHEVARRFGTNAGALRQTLAAYGMDADDIVHSGFDLASAQIDIMVAPEGISRRELARPLFDEFQSAPRKARNWAKVMEDAGRQIENTIGRDGRWSPTPRDPAGKQS